MPEQILALSTMTGPGYADAFTLVDRDDRVASHSAEQWARALFFDNAGRGGQLIWRGLLGLRLHAAPDRVAGWEVAERGRDWIRLEARSWFLTGQLVVRVSDDRVTMGTFVGYDRQLACLVWPPLSRVHRRLTPGLLRGARRTVSSRSQPAADGSQRLHNRS